MSKARTYEQVKARIAQLENEEGLTKADRRRARICAAELRWVLGEAEAVPIEKFNIPPKKTNSIYSV